MPGGSSGRAQPLVVSFTVARIVAVVIAVLIWAAILAAVGSIFGRVLAQPAVSPAAWQVSAWVVVPFVAFFTAHGVWTGLLEGLALGRFTAPPVRGAATGSGRNPWVVAVAAYVVLGVPVAVGGVAAVAWLTGEGAAGLHPGAYAVRLGILGVIAAALVAWWVSGAPLGRELAGLREPPSYAGSLRRYLVRRHVAPHALANAAINGWVAVALTPAGGVAPPSLLVGDALVAGVIIAAATSFGARNHARTDAHVGLLGVPGRAPARWVQGCGALAVGALAAALLAGALALASVGDGLRVEAFVVVKGAMAAAIAAAAAWAGGRWGLVDGTRRRGA
jgi:hypothetical protein